MNKDTAVGIVLIALIVFLVVYAASLHGLLYVGITVAIGMLALVLYSSKSKASKIEAFVLFPELLTKLLMPKITKKAIKDLEKKMKKNHNNKFVVQPLRGLDAFSAPQQKR